MSYKYRILDSFYIEEMKKKDKSTFMFSINNDIKKEKQFLLRYSRPDNNERLMSYRRCKEWIKEHHPELLL